MFLGTEITMIWYENSRETRYIQFFPPHLPAFEHEANIVNTITKWIHENYAKIAACYFQINMTMCHDESEPDETLILWPFSYEGNVKYKRLIWKFQKYIKNAVWREKKYFKD